jgi:hypothetical protein
MKWILVYIIINAQYEPIVINAMGPRVMHNDMYECFEARERLSETVGTGDGYFGPGKQAVCIPIESADL